MSKFKKSLTAVYAALWVSGTYTVYNFDGLDFGESAKIEQAKKTYETLKEKRLENRRASRS